MQQKYYAVRVGRTPGIYLNWEDCRKQVEGFQGASYKSFSNAGDAADFLHYVTDTAVNSDEQGIPVTDERTVVAYVDGSYNAKTKQFSYGMVLFHNGEEKHFSQRVEDTALAEMRNVAGEIKGAEAAMRYAVEHQADTLVIYHDYEGIASWCLGKWKTNKAGTIAYKEFYDKIKDSVKITFVKVKGHSNNTYNDMADNLAKQAIF